jgi:beta-glucanase (GH16 family)
MPRDFPAPDQFHTYAIDWSENTLTFLFDGQPVRTLTPAGLPAGAKWVYDQPHFLLLNLAVGGGWPGNPDANTVFPRDYVIDYVRVYRK